MKELEQAAEEKYTLLDDKYEVMPASKRAFNAKQLEMISAFIAGANWQSEQDNWINDTIIYLNDKIEPEADKQMFDMEFTKGRNQAFRMCINVLEFHLQTTSKITTK